MSLLTDLPVTHPTAFTSHGNEDKFNDEFDGNVATQAPSYGPVTRQEADGMGQAPGVPAASRAAARAPALRRVSSPEFRTQLFDQGLLIDTGVDGLYGRSKAFEDVVERISDLIGAWGMNRPVEVLRFPPAMNRAVLEESGYWKNFPTQIGSIFSFCGDEPAQRRLLACLDDEKAWSAELSPNQLAITPVACYPVYPVMAARGRLPAGGRTLDIFSYCCRHEPSLDAERMIMFRQREFVRMGSPEEILEFRDDWIAHARWMVERLQLPATVAVANDPFFGRTGRVMADSQRSQALKFELLIPAINPDRPTAVGSFNYHRDRFSALWDIRTAEHAIAHTGCCGFGLERFALSLFKVHGFEIARWPDSVRTTLWPTATV